MLDGDRKGAGVVLEQARHLAADAGDGDLDLDIDVVAGITDLQLGRREEGESDSAACSLRPLREAIAITRR